LASKVKLRIILLAPVKAGLEVELAFAFEALNMRSADVPKVGAEFQFVEVPKFPEVVPVQVDCANTVGEKTPAASASKSAIRIRTREGDEGLEFMAGGMSWGEGSRKENG
jgi:hypothetical protein